MPKEDIEQICKERYERVPDLIWEIDRNGVYTFANSVLGSMLGYRESEILGKPIFDFLAQEDKDKFHHILEEAVSTQQPIRNIIHRTRARDGLLKTLESSCVPIYEDSELTGFRGISRDIIDEIIYQRAAREALANYRAALDNAPTGVVVIQNDHVVYFNPKMAEIAGYNFDEMSSFSFQDTIRNEQKEVMEARCKSLLAGEDVSVEFDLDIVSKSGEVRRLETRETVITYNGDPAVMCNAIDRTERIRAEREKQELEERLHQIFEHAFDPIFMLDLTPNGDFIISAFNPAAERVTGLEAEDVLGKKTRDVFPLATVEIISGFVKQCIETGEPVCFESDQNLASGSWVFELVFVPIRDVEGNAYRVVGLAHDETERRRAEVELRKAEEKYRKIFESAAIGIFQTTPSGQFLSLNPTLASMFLYSSPKDMMESVQDIAEQLFVHPEQRKEVVEAVMAHEGFLRFETDYYRKDRSIITTNLYMRAVRDENGEVMYLEGFVEDITERKRIEQEKRVFYRETIASVTQGKLNLITGEEAKRILVGAKISAPVLHTSDVVDVRQRLKDFLSCHCIEGDDLALFLTAIGEAMNNVLKHAGAGEVYAGADDGQIWVAVSDKGSGIDTLTLPSATLRRRFSTKISMGMGYTIMLDVADRVLLSTGSEGTTVVLVKKPMSLKPVLCLEDFPDTWGDLPAC